ncbi:SCO2322 family protein [Knoellia sp. p5-6-4]|uniref:SCO2322 family protein n=1 Tax=unclassified Knoellia TaxID=2618719 RepID=UPI0023DC0C88|nr:SCO2322 family protein [Knoellia sp. p5-6-4]MDF2143680.1 SCO2322 family protein [Knoellia sp. p5-6-4]
MSRTTRPVVAVPSLVAAVLLALVAAVVAPAAPASAAAYRYWGYFQLQDATWAFASKGADQLTPADGSVEGWRFAVAGETDARMPRATASFDDLCGDAAAEAGKKRVGVVIDYGRAADTEDGKQPPAPVGRCAVVDTKATGAEVLAAVASVRAEGAMICGIDNHPATGCGGEVKVVSPEAKATDTPVQLAAATPSADAAQAPADDADQGGTSALTYAALAIVLAVVALLITAAARRRRAN